MDSHSSQKFHPPPERQRHCRMPSPAPRCHGPLSFLGFENRVRMGMWSFAWLTAEKSLARVHQWRPKSRNRVGGPPTHSGSVQLRGTPKGTPRYLISLHLVWNSPRDHHLLDVDHPVLPVLTSSSAKMSLEQFQTELIEHAMAVGALKFGIFTLKSGRSVPSPAPIS